MASLSNQDFYARCHGAWGGPETVPPKQSGTQNEPGPQQPRLKHTWPPGQLTFDTQATSVQVGVTQTVEPPMVGMQAQAPAKQENVSHESGIGHIVPEICWADTFVTLPIIIGAT